MSRRRDPETLDLFREFTPAPVVERFEQERVRALRASARIARAVAEAIKQSRRNRHEIAKEMSDFLGEEVSVSMLDQYSSTANEKNNIPAHRLVALLAVTNDIRIFNAVLHDTGFVAVDARYEPLIRREMLKEAGERLAREQSSADAQWRGQQVRAFCYASGLIEFGYRVPAGALPIAVGRPKPLLEFIETQARHGYTTTEIVTGRPQKIPGTETLLVPGVPEAPNQGIALDKLHDWLGWIADKAPIGVEVL